MKDELWLHITACVGGCLASKCQPEDTGMQKKSVREENSMLNAAKICTTVD